VQEKGGGSACGGTLMAMYGGIIGEELFRRGLNTGTRRKGSQFVPGVLKKGSKGTRFETGRVRTEAGRGSRAKK